MEPFSKPLFKEHLAEVKQVAQEHRKSIRDEEILSAFEERMTSGYPEGLEKMKKKPLTCSQNGPLEMVWLSGSRGEGKS